MAGTAPLRRARNALNPLSYPAVYAGPVGPYTIGRPKRLFIAESLYILCVTCCAAGEFSQALVTAVSGAILLWYIHCQYVVDLGVGKDAAEILRGRGEEADREA